MTRTITRSEFQNAAGEAVYVSHVHYQSRAEQAAGDAACQAVVVAAAFQPAPFGGAGEPFDPPEYATQPVSESYTTEAVLGGVTMPPNCDGLSVAEALTLIHEERGD